MDDELAKGFAAQNQLYATVAGMLKSQPEAVDDVKKLQAPTYQADLTAIQRSFMSAVQAVKKEVGNDLVAQDPQVSGEDQIVVLRGGSRGGKMGLEGVIGRRGHGGAHVVGVGDPQVHDTAAGDGGNRQGGLFRS